MKCPGRKLSLGVDVPSSCSRHDGGVLIMRETGMDRVRRVAGAFGRGVLGAVRFSLYVVLLVVGRVLVPLASLAVVGGLILFLFCLLFWREHVGLMVAGGCLAVGGVLLQVFYQAALRLVAPEGVVVVSEL